MTPIRHLFVPRLHIGDTLLRQEKWEEARDAYDAVMKRDEHPHGHTSGCASACCMTYLGAKDDAGARTRRFERITFPTETPAYYYAQAAWAFAHGNKRDGEKWMRTAGEIFDAKTTAWFARPLYELGWIKNEAAARDRVAPALRAQPRRFAAREDLHVLPHLHDARGRQHAAEIRARINDRSRPSTDAGIDHRVAADLRAIADDRAELLQPGRDVAIVRAHVNLAMIELHVRQNHAGAEVRSVAEDRVADVVEMRHLRFVEEDRSS